MKNNTTDRKDSPTTAETSNTTGGETTRFVPLPAAPKTGSPVPWLTSIHATPGRGDYGDPSYRGNCSGLLIKDLLLYYRPSRVLDPMAGSGTCGHVCSELGIKCTSLDLRTGHDATTQDAFQKYGKFDFIWLHPPYWQMIHWTDDPRCLANAPTRLAFLLALQRVIHNCKWVMRPAAHLAILMGDYPKGGEYQSLPFLTWDFATGNGLVLAAPEIIRFSHGALSSNKEYKSSFIPRLHDVCLVFKQRPPQPKTRAA